MWRALKDSLPSKLNLKKRHVLEDLECEISGATSEDILHALWSCSHAQAA
jgi:hypothetical protein